MWMSARQCRDFVPGATVSTLWDPMSANVLLAIARVKPATSVKVSLSGKLRCCGWLIKNAITGVILKKVDQAAQCEPDFKLASHKKESVGH